MVQSTVQAAEEGVCHDIMSQLFFKDKTVSITIISAYGKKVM